MWASRESWNCSALAQSNANGEQWRKISTQQNCKNHQLAIEIGQIGPKLERRLVVVLRTPSPRVLSQALTLASCPLDPKRKATSMCECETR